MWKATTELRGSRWELLPELQPHNSVVWSKSARTREALAWGCRLTRSTKSDGGRWPILKWPMSARSREPVVCDGMMSASLPPAGAALVADGLVGGAGHQWAPSGKSPAAVAVDTVDENVEKALGRR